MVAGQGREGGAGGGGYGAWSAARWLAVMPPPPADETGERGKG